MKTPEKCKDCVYKNEQGNCWAIKAKCNPAHMFCDYRFEADKKISKYFWDGKEVTIRKTKSIL